MSRALVVVTWCGSGPPLSRLELDAEPDFELVCFDYSGTQTVNWLPETGVRLLTRATECKGQILDALAETLASTEVVYDYISVIDDDVEISLSAINQALRIGRRLGLLTFSPSLTSDSLGYHSHMFQREGFLYRRVLWVEIMMPFIAMDLFMAAAPYYSLAISAAGIDCFVYPVLARLLSLEGGHAVFDCVVAAHRREVTSGQRRFSNGCTAMEEAGQLRWLCQQLLAEQKPELLLDRDLRLLLGLAGHACV